MSQAFCLSNIPSSYTNKCYPLILHSLFTLSIPSKPQLFPLLFFLLSHSMIPELEKPRVTEIQVRMDCNGCVQKIKKALQGVNGIYDLYIDFPQQKLTIIGWADPEKIMKAIKKTRKIATICSHTEPTDPAAKPPEQAPEGGVPPPAEAAADPPPAEAPPAEAAHPAEPPKDPPLENRPPDATPPPGSNANAGNPARPRDVEEVHVIYHHPTEYAYRYGYSHPYGGHWNNYYNVQGSQQQGLAPTTHTSVQGLHEPQPTNYTDVQVLHHEPPPPVYVTHRYNTYKPPPYVTEYEHIRPPPWQAQYSRMDRYSEDYHNVNNNNGNITSMFSDENPNACRIV